MDTLAVVRELVKQAHQWFEGTVADVTLEVANFTPAGVAPRVGARLAHLVISEDVLINSILKSGAPMFATTWAGKTGVSDPKFEQGIEWDRSIILELPELMDYMRAVFANTEAILAAMKAEEMDRTVDMSRFGYGTPTTAMWFGIFIIAHTHDISGEISAVKGLLGKKGYPA